MFGPILFIVYYPSVSSLIEIHGWGGGGDFSVCMRAHARGCMYVWVQVGDVIYFFFNVSVDVTVGVRALFLL